MRVRFAACDEFEVSDGIHTTMLASPPDVPGLTAGLTSLGLRKRRRRADARTEFLEACAGGDQPHARQLTVMAELTAADARSLSNEAFRSACAGGHLPVAQWLTARFGLTAEDARTGDNDALRSACRQGHLEVVQWLIDAFQLTATDLVAEAAAPLREACAGGHLATAQWLYARVSASSEQDVLTRIPPDALACGALHRACAHGRLTVARWLWTLTGAGPHGGSPSWGDPTEARAELRRCLRAACLGGHLDVAVWLVAAYGLDAEDARAGYGALACARDYPAITQWLTAILGV
jgi:hypothetical protein